MGGRPFAGDEADGQIVGLGLRAHRDARPGGNAIVFVGGI
jgi:hypothetical protein